MGPNTDHRSRLDWWRGQIQRQPKTNLTIADFCRQLGVSVPTFYYWKRRVKAGLWTLSEPVVEASLSRPPTTAAADYLPMSIVDPRPASFGVSPHFGLALAFSDGRARQSRG
jgi:hypothetical protein